MKKQTHISSISHKGEKMKGKGNKIPGDQILVPSKIDLSCMVNICIQGHFKTDAHVLFFPFFSNYKVRRKHRKSE